jgi:hypothetical protein
MISALLSFVIPEPWNCQTRFPDSAMGWKIGRVDGKVLERQILELRKSAVCGVGIAIFKNQNVCYNCHPNH